MITYVMNNNKSIRKTIDGKVYQREKLVDKVQFILPQNYEEHALKDFTVMLKYKDTNNMLRNEVLTMNDDNYKEKYLQYVLPIDTKITNNSGDVTFRLTLTKVDTLENTEYVLHTGDAVLTVSPVSDLFDFKTDESLEFIDQKMAQIEAMISAMDIAAGVYDATKADDIEISEDKTEITLTANGAPIGTPITLVDLHDDTDTALDNETVTVVEL